MDLPPLSRPGRGAPRNSQRSLSAHELARSPWLDIIDLRSRDERARLGFIPGSIQCNDAALGELAQNADNAVLVCQFGRRSEERVMATQERTGFRFLTDGISGWTQAGLPLSTLEARVANSLPPVESVDAVMTLLRAALTGEFIERTSGLPLEGIDPNALFERALERAHVTHGRVTLQELDSIADHVLSMSRRIGTPLERVAAVGNRITAAITRLRAVPPNVVPLRRATPPRHLAMYQPKRKA